MKERTAARLERCAYCGGNVKIRCGYMGITFFDCTDCGACVSFKNLKYPLRLQADNPVACFNRRYKPPSRRQKRRTKEDNHGAFDA